MEKKIRRVKLNYDCDGHKNMYYLSGRISGMMYIGSHDIPEPQVGLEKIRDENHKQIADIHTCKATDEEWFKIKTFLFEGTAFPELIEIVEE